MPGCSCVATCQRMPAGCSNVTVDRPIVEAVRPHDRRRHVDVRVRRVDGEIRAVDAIAEHLVLHGHAAAVTGDVPAVRIRPASSAARGRRRRRRARRRRSSRNRAANSGPATSGSCAARACRLPSSGNERFDLHPAMLRLGKRQAIADRRRGVKRASRCDEKQATTRKRFITKAMLARRRRMRPRQG